jgi:hypothetical protein
MSVVRLIDRTGSAKSWGPQDVCDALQKDIDEGKVKNKVLILHVDQDNGRFNTSFLQCGMSASEMIMLLEIAKQDIYRNQMCK